jgi:hypothetical protein
MLAKKCLVVGVITLLGLNMALAQDAPAVHPLTGDDLVIDCLRGTPVAIDGDLSDWSLDAMPVALVDVAEQLNSGQANWSDADDLSGAFYLLWDDQNIYIAAIIKDDKLSMNKTGGNIWNADCVEIFFSTLNAVSGHDEHYQYGFNANGQTWLWDDMEGGGQSAVDYMEMAAVETADGYICEVAIPHAEITPLDWSVGSAIGFHPVMDDTDNGDREIQMTWTSREAHDQSLGFGHLILSAEAARLPELGSHPNPEHGAVDVPLGLILTWDAGDYAVTHDVYFGTSYVDVNDATTPDSAGQSDMIYDPGPLDYGQTYYWRVDEVNGAPDNTVFKGEVWNFQIEPFSIPVEGISVTASSSNSDLMGPEKTIDGSGLNELDQHSTVATDMWLSAAGPAPWIQYEFDKVYKLDQLLVWNSNQLVESFLGLGAKDVTIETSVDGAAWTALEGPIVFSQGTSMDDYAANTSVDFAGTMAQYVKITINAGYGMIPQYGLSEVRFLAIPTSAREPEPADGTTTDTADVVLDWRAGREAVSNEVYLGTDAANLDLVGTTGDSSFAAGILDYGTSYYWSVTSINEAETPSAYAGTVWSFTLPEYGVVDDFEQYDNQCNRIFFAWEDGLGHNGGTEIEGCDEPASNGNGGGSIVGNDQAPFAEKSIVNVDSKQSMPLNYDNSFGPSEATLTIPGQDWSAGGVTSLSLFFYGEADNSGQLYVKINNTKVAYSGDAADIAQAQWLQWNIDLSSVAGLQNVTALTIGVDGASAAGMLYIDDIRLSP